MRAHCNAGTQAWPAIGPVLRYALGMILLQTQDLEWAVRSPFVAPAAEVEEAWNIQVIQDVLIVANSASM